MKGKPLEKANVPRLMQIGQWYLASPYTNHAAGTGQAIREIRYLTTEFLKVGVAAFAPIAYTGPLADYFPDWRHEDWMEVDLPFMNASAGCCFVQLDGWQQSAGMLHEFWYFMGQNKPVFAFDPNENVFTPIHRPTDLRWTNVLADKLVKGD